MDKIKILVVVGTRPEIIRLSEIMKQLDKDYKLVVVNSMQNFDENLNKVFFEDLGLRDSDYVLEMSRMNTMGAISKILIEVDRILEIENPDAFLVLGDTNSCLSVLSAKKRRIPVFHLEAGNRCFDETVPEEINRRVVDHIADVNFTYSLIAREYLIREGKDPYFIVKIGSPMKEVINSQKSKIEKSEILGKLGLTKDNYFVMSIHRDENVTDRNILNNLKEIVDYICDEIQIKLILTLHPKTKENLNKHGIKLNSSVIVCLPLKYTDYMKLQINSKLVISDSGSINEESSILKFQAINFRKNHERPESNDEANTILSGVETSHVIQAINMTLNQMTQNIKIQPVSEYEIENVSVKVSRNIMSYIQKIGKIIPN